MTHGHLIGVTGIPGSGKSYFARSARECGKTAIATPDPKELSFYAKDIALFCDLDWRPHLNEWKATALTELLAWLAARDKDDTQYIVVDPFSEVSDLAFHEVLKVHATNDPREVEYGRAYTAHDQQIKAVITELRRLTVHGKTVICTFHGKMRELEGAGDAKKKKAMTGEMEWAFEEQMLPAMNSGIRQSIHSAFNLWLFTKPVGFGPGQKFFVTAQPDAVRPAKHSVVFKEGANIAMIPNTVRALLDLIQQPESPTRGLLPQGASK